MKIIKTVVLALGLVMTANVHADSASQFLLKQSDIQRLQQLDEQTLKDIQALAEAYLKSDQQHVEGLAVNPAAALHEFKMLVSSPGGLIVVAALIFSLIKIGELYY